ncbi:MAG TPA: Ger(x)C family spore germination protein [Clostridia bacterium]
MHRIYSFILLCCLILSFFTACTTGAHEIDDWAYVSSIGIDKGISDALRFTFQIPTLKKGSGEGGGGSSSQGKIDTSVMSIDAPTFYAAVNSINTSLSRTLDFSHAKYVVVGEKQAREGVSKIVNSIIRSSQVRRISHFIIAKGSASEFIKALNPVLGTSLSRTQELLMSQEDLTGLFDDISYDQFSIGMKNSYSDPAAALVAVNDFSNYKESGTPPNSFKSGGEYIAGELPRSGGNKYEFFGSAIFDGDKMVGELNGNETRAMRMARGDYKTGAMAIADPEDPKLRITCNISQMRDPDIKITFNDGKPVINLKIFLEGDLLNIQSTNEYENPKIKPILENAYETYIKDLLDKTIDKCKRLNCDVFNFGQTAAMHFLTIPEWKSYNWLSHFKNAEVNTEVQYTIRRTGTLMKTSPTQTSEGEEK